ncbi:MAG: hypothetical protein JEZ14_19915 [Marinilabiliaceae bacterium]|nr:hypothetical protein [Marinilabiliaceae bacterium]
MKKLGKLKISPEKVMKNEELLNLRGGSYEGGACCKVNKAGSQTYCDSMDLINAWADFWTSAGYSIDCNYVHYT